jgi:site-specific DNA-methyltransferase (adenine-specific)
MRKVANRLAVLEERYKDLSPKQRARKINEELSNFFCVKERQIKEWKRVVNIANRHEADICLEISPSHLMEIARLPDNKIPLVMEQVKNRKLTVKETRGLVNSYLTDVGPVELSKGELQLIHGDFTETKEIPEDSIDLILTDPPYGKQYLPLWESLGEFANKVLKKSGFLVAYAGQLYLKDILDNLSKNLSYYWTFALFMESRDLINGRNIYCQWKPIVCFYKEPLEEKQDYFKDIIKGTGREKENHEWQQSEKELGPIIEYFCPKGGTVLDPMAGSGTTLIATYKLGRKAIGIEKDQITFNEMKMRLNNDITKT